MNSIRFKLEDRIRRKEQEIAELEHQVSAAKEYVKATREALGMIIKDDGSDPSGGFRANSAAAHAMEFLRREGRAHHINAIVVGMGKKNDRNNRSSVSSTLSTYARQGKVFSKPAANTFGLLEWEDAAQGSNGKQPDAQS